MQETVKLNASFLPSTECKSFSKVRGKNNPSQDTFITTQPPTKDTNSSNTSECDQPDFFNLRIFSIWNEADSEEGFLHRLGLAPLISLCSGFSTVLVHLLRVRERWQKLRATTGETRRMKRRRGVMNQSEKKDWNVVTAYWFQLLEHSSCFLDIAPHLSPALKRSLTRYCCSAPGRPRCLPLCWLLSWWVEVWCMAPSLWAWLRNRAPSGRWASAWCWSLSGFDSLWVLCVNRKTDGRWCQTSFSLSGSHEGKQKHERKISAPFCQVY